MNVPAIIRTAVSSDALGKVTRLFNGSIDDMLAELLQNARRAEASGVAIVTEPDPNGDTFRLTVIDDGCGIADAQSALTLGSSTWDADTMLAEDPAGMGLFALAGRNVRIASCGAQGAWTVDIPGDAWDSAADLVLEPEDRSQPRGTTISVELPVSWEKSVRYAAERAARHFPLAVSLNGEVLQRSAFLAEALHVETWRGLSIGVERGPAHDSRRINFHGVTVPCALPSVAEVRAEHWIVRIDVIDCPELQLVLPARKEVVATPFLDELRQACERIIYRFIATRDGHRLTYRDWCRAAELGVSLPPAAATLQRWSPATNDGGIDCRWRDRFAGGPLPADAILIGHVDADRAQSLARALDLDGPGLKARLFESIDAFQGYDWYDALPRVVDVVGAVILDGALWSTDLDDAPPANGRTDRASVALEIHCRDDRRIRPLETDMLLFAGDEWLCDEPDGQSVFVTPSTTLSPPELADHITAAFFLASDDRDADSWDTQHEHYRRAALDLARRVLLDDEQANLARIRDALQDHIAWLVPKDCELRIRYDRESLDVSLVDLAEQAPALQPGPTEESDRETG